VRTLSLTQPWASLVAAGAKRIETRSWRTSYRGPVAIHAAKGFPGWARSQCLDDPFHLALFDQCASEADLLASASRLGELPLGAVIATARLVCCEPTTGAFAADMLSRHGARFETSFGDYSDGRWMWLLEDVRALAEPIPARGSLGLWEWDAPADLESRYADVLAPGRAG
jgi:hypothetical protein